MGAIVYWALIRIVLLLPLLWIALDYVEYKYWWAFFSLAFYGIVIQPIIIQYKLFKEKNKKIISDSICSFCKHFNESAILCLKHDVHPTEEVIPCNGIDWEPKET